MDGGGEGGGRWRAGGRSGGVGGGERQVGAGGERVKMEGRWTQVEEEEEEWKKSAA